MLSELIPKIRTQIAAEQTWGHYELLIRQLIGAETAIALVSFHEYVVYSTPQVFDLLDRYFPASPKSREHLPQELVILLRNRQAAGANTTTFSVKDSQAFLTVTICDSENGDQQILLFKEVESAHRKLARRFDLSPRLIDVVLLVEDGHSNKQIAQQLNLNPNTIRTMVETLLTRMHASNRTQLASLTRRCLDS